MATSIDNISKITEAVKMAVQKVENIGTKRTTLNAEMQEVLSKLESDHGFHRDAVRTAIRVMNMDPDKRAMFDVAYGVVRTIAGQPLQADLFSVEAGMNRLSEIQQAAIDQDGEGEPGDAG